MLLKWVEAEGFLSFGEAVRLEVGPGLVVVTGPNGAGKSNLGRCLDLARAVVGRAGGDPAAERLGLYDDAGYEGAGSFSVRLGVELDQGWERDLIWAFVCACYASGATAGQGQSEEELDAEVREWLGRDSLAPLWSGSLVVRRQVGVRSPWFAAWEFTHSGEAWHAVLAGDGAEQLRPGTAEFPVATYGSGPLKDWLRTSRLGGEGAMDFRAALENADTVTFSAGVATGGPIESLRDLGSMLGVDPRNRSFGFDHVISAVLQRGIVLTDNRRLPLRRVFSLGELRQAADLRDGAAVAAELYRLKNGYPADRDRFAKITRSFQDLTGRSLDVRARPAPTDEGDAAMIIEPTVAGLHGERLVELSGAGMQEALVLSVLLLQDPGRVVVLDEPAVNLEPTVQRRLISRVRGPGQYVVITHSADLVPVEEPGDLGKIVRVAPGPTGSQVRQPRFADLGTDEMFQQSLLLEPAHVRGLLFAAGVILCEGPSEVGTLPRWWRRGADSLGLPDPGAANISVISVGGQDSFGAYVRYLEAFGVPWAIVADGPALRPGSKLAGRMRKLGHWPDKEPDDQDDFAQWREFWEGLGVFSLADRFGDDGTKSGEFEAYLKRVDRDLYAKVGAEVGKRNKPRVAAYFAVRHPEPPPEVLDMYHKIAARLGIPGSATGPSD